MKAPAAAKSIALASIITTGATQPRESVDLIVVSDYRALMDAGSKFPAVDVFTDGTSTWLADGFHRVYAARLNPPYTRIAAVVHRGGLRDAILWSVGANSTHGRPRTNEDKRRAVLTLLNDKDWRRWSNTEIARRCRVSEFLVRTVRGSLRLERSDGTRYTTKHGTVAVMATTRIGKSGDLRPKLLAAIGESVMRDDPHAVARLSGLDDAKQDQVAAVMVKHPELRTVQDVWARINRQENIRRVDNLPDRGDRWTIHHCSALELVDKLPPKSIDVIITDPPYSEEYLSVYADLSTLGAHVLRDGGLCVVMTGKTHLPEYMAGLGSALAYHWIAPILLTSNARVWDRRVFTRWKPLLVYARGSYTGPMWHDVITADDHPSDKADHKWQQGDALTRQIVDRFSQPAAVVLDPFVGSGTTAIAALELDRVFVGADVDKDTVLTARRRVIDHVGATKRKAVKS